MANKRKHERVKPIDHFLVVDTQTDKFIGRVVNMSSGGIKVIGVNQISVSNSYHCRMALPEKINGKNEIMFTAECKWSDKNDFMKMYETGFEFKQISDQDQDILQSLLNEWCMTKSGSIKMETHRG
jgi:c-di-GMP-binding flagellar brake protein YcgR